MDRPLLRQSQFSPLPSIALACNSPALRLMRLPLGDALRLSQRVTEITTSASRTRPVRRKVAHRKSIPPYGLRGTAVTAPCIGATGNMPSELGLSGLRPLSDVLTAAPPLEIRDARDAVKTVGA